MKMNNLDHVKNFYPENYKLDLSETMKAALSKGGPSAAVLAQSAAVNMPAPSSTHGSSSDHATSSGSGYVTEKLYMLLQLYLQNKGWNPSAELLQCFTDLKDNAMLPSAAYLQVLANRMTLDSQGRLILRENGKIVLPFEHFANAVMLKHMSGPHGLHLGIDATVRAVLESYSIGRENFGMEKEFIIEVVQSCPSPACRYYKTHMGISPLPSFMDQQFPGVNPTDFLQHLPHLPPPPPPGVGSTVSPSSVSSTSSAASSIGATNCVEVDLTSKSSHSSHPKVPSQLQHLTKQQQSQLSQITAAAAKQQQQQQQQLTAALIQQQNRALAQQSLEKFNTLSPMEKQRVLAQIDPKHFDPNTMAVAAAAASLQMQGLMQSQAAAVAAQTASLGLTVANQSTAPVVGHHHLPPPPSPSPNAVAAHNARQEISTTVSSHSVDQMLQKNVEALRSNLESLESNKDLLALHNGAWTSSSASQDLSRDVLPVGQDKIVRVFTELMRNMARMKTYIRPSMCKPYGKQSESLQKTLMDTIQIVQTLRNCLPPPHINVSSWKSESEGTTNLTGSIAGVATNLSTVVGAGTPLSLGNGGGGGGGVGPLLGNLSANRIENLSN